MGGLIRSKLTPDGSKLVISTSHGYMMIIHAVDLVKISEDLHTFKPTSYRLMQLNQSHGRCKRHNLSHIFTSKRNRVEFVTDFPLGDEAGLIASLEVHPQGWCIASRNTAEDESTEVRIFVMLKQRHHLSLFTVDMCA
jgi:WD repeat-containing protein 32